MLRSKKVPNQHRFELWKNENGSHTESVPLIPFKMQIVFSLSNMKLTLIFGFKKRLADKMLTITLESVQEKLSN